MYIYIYIDIYIQICVCVCVCVCASVCVCTCIYIYTYKYICIWYIYLYTCTFIYIYTDAKVYLRQCSSRRRLICIYTDAKVYLRQCSSRRRRSARTSRRCLQGTHRHSRYSRGPPCLAHRGARRCGRTGAQLLRVGVRGASRMSVQVDAAADVEPETAGRQGRSVHTASVRLAADGRQALARRVGCDLRIAVRAGPAVERADERCAQRGPAWLWTWRHNALSRRRQGGAASSGRCGPPPESTYHPQG
jgi:hypothetical protein